jgi:hypothetical protein
MFNSIANFFAKLDSALLKRDSKIYGTARKGVVTSKQELRSIRLALSDTLADDKAKEAPSSES